MKIKRGILLFICMYLMCMNISDYMHITAWAEVHAKIEGTLKSTSEDPEYLEFLVKMKEQADTEDIVAAEEDKAEQVVGELIDTAETSQQDIITYLEEELSEGNVKSYKSFFIVNSISVTAKREVIYELAKRSDIEKIVEDKIIEEEPVKKDTGFETENFSMQEASDVKRYPWNLKSILVDRALEQEDVSGKGVVVGIIDSGVDFNHPAIQAAYRGNNSEFEIYSWYDTTDRQNFGKDDKPSDATGHGTHVAGTILGNDPYSNNVIGIAPEAQWIAARVFDEDGETSLTRLLEAGQWMLAPTDRDGVPHPDMAPDIVNNSWGGKSETEFFRDILKQWRAAGILPIFSAGNTGPSNQGGDGSIGTPASYPEAFAVGALRRDDKIAAFSLRGPSVYKGVTKPDISAPGVNVRSSVVGGGYEIRSGTSMAGPHVSGVAALVLEANPELTPDELEKILEDTAIKLVDSKYVKSPNHGYGYGKINAYSAVKSAKNKKEGNSDQNYGFGSVSGRLLKRGSDINTPAIDHLRIKNMYNTYDFDVEARVNDDNGINSVKLYIADALSEEFKSKDMELIEGDKVSGRYKAILKPDDLSSEDMKYYIEAVDITGKILRTETYQVKVKGGVGIGYKQDFEENAEGFEFGGKTPMWEWGIAKSGPNKAYSGSKLVGTKLEGNYKGLIDTLLVMPAVDLSNETSPAALSFKHWYELDDYQSGIFDTAEVWIGVIPDNSSSAEDVKYENARVYTRKSSDWKSEYIDLSKYQGKKILIMFGMRYLGSSAREKAGWYIDDISIEKASEDIPKAPSKYIDLRYKTGGFVYSFSPVEGEKITSYGLYRSNSPKGPYELVNKIDRKDAGKYTVALSDYPKPQAGTYYYYAKAFIGSNESEASQVMSHTFTEGKEYIKYDFEDGEQGWFSEADTKGNVWSRGIVNPVEMLQDDKIGSMPIISQSKAKNDGSPNVWGTVLNDFRKSDSTYTLISPDMDLSKLSKAAIYMQTWYNTGGRKGMSEYGDNFDEDQGTIFISKDGGSNWTSLFELKEDTIENKNRFKGVWYLDGFEIPSDYLSSQFKLKYVLKAGSEITGGNCGGWYIDDVSIYDLSKSEEIIGSDQTESYDASNLEMFELTDMRALDASDNVEYKGVLPLYGEISILETGVNTSTETGTGIYSIRHNAGEYKLVAQAEGYQKKEFVVNIEEGKNTELDIVLDKLINANLQFSVKDKQNKPIDKVKTKLYREGSEVPVYSADSSEVSIKDIYPATYKLIINAKGFKSIEKSLDVEPAKSIDLGTIHLDRLKEEGEEALRELNKDDGKAENYVNNLSDGKTIGVKFHVDKLSSVKNLKFMFVKAASNTVSTVGKKFRYSIYDKNDIDEYPGKLIAGPFIADVAKENEWTEIELDEAVQVDGDFFVAYTQIGDGDGTPYIGVDKDTEGKHKSYVMLNGAWNEPSIKGMFMIRAGISPVSILDENLSDDPDKKNPQDNKGGNTNPKPNKPDIEKHKNGYNSGSGSASKSGTSKKAQRYINRDSKAVPMPDNTVMKAGKDGDWVVIGFEHKGFGFKKADGSLAKGWQKIVVEDRSGVSTKYYLFGEDGILKSGWFLDTDGRWYYLSENKDTSFGIMKTGWYQDNKGHSYYLDEQSGAMIVGWRRIGDKEYFFNTSKSAKERGFGDDTKWFLGAGQELPYGALIK